jgi:hypothetical protein
MFHSRADFAPVLSSNFPILYLPITYHVLRILTFGVWFFGLRSSHLHPLSQDMLLGNRFSEVSGVRRWSRPSPSPPGCRRVLPTRPIVLPFNWHVELTPASSSTFCFNPRRLQKILFLPVVERPPLGGACFSHASRNGSHPTSHPTRLVLAVCDFFYCIFGFFC